MIKTYRKKPIVIEAVELTSDNFDDILEWMSSPACYNGLSPLRIQTLEGEMKAMPGDFIIKGVNGEFYPCKPDIFHKTYEETT